MEALTKAYDILFWGALIVFALCLTACLIRAILGPRTSDRIVSINMIGTITIIMLAIFSVLLDQNYLADVCIIYAMLSFISVIVLTKIYMGVHAEHALKKSAKGPDDTVKGGDAQ